MFIRVFVWLELMVVLVGALACEKQRTGAPLPSHAFQFPTGIAVLNSAGFALVASSNFDLTYESGSLRVLDLSQVKTRLDQQNPKDSDPTDNGNYFSDLILDDFAVSLGNFAGKMDISVISSDQNIDQAIAAVTIRETNQLVLIDLTVDNSGETPVLKSLSCSSSGNNSNVKFPACAGSQNIVQLDQNALQFDPFGIVLLDRASSTDKLAYISFLRSGTLSVVDIPADRSKPIASGLGPATGLSTGSYQGDEGINDLAYSPTSKHIYFTARPVISTNTTSSTTTVTSTNTTSSTTTQTDPIFFTLFDATSIDPSDPTTYAAAPGALNLYPFFLGTETRGLAFGSDGTTLAIVVLNPNMLLFLDTSNNNNYLGSVVLGQNPELIYRNKGTGAPNPDLFFVTCDQENTVYIIDGLTRRLLQVREDICGGPFDMAFFDRDSDNLHWALFSCFEDDSVTVLDVNPSNSETYLKVLAHVGKPRT